MNQPAFIAGAPVTAFKSSFTTGSVCAQRPAQPAAGAAGAAQWTMGKQSKFGPFTPAVIATKLVIGEKNLNQLRGKAIALHSKAITAFCEATGADRKTRQDLIRAAKNNGNTLGFLY